MNLAIQALVEGLTDGGCGYATNVPGFESHTIFGALGGTSSSLNEKIAYEMAYGASLAGVRSVVSMKNAGLNIAADPYLNSIISGVHAGLVLIVTDDVEMEGSQSRQDSRHFIDFFGGLWFEPNSIERAYEVGYHAFSRSERFDVPVVIRLTNQFFGLTGSYRRKRSRMRSFVPARNKRKLFMHPATWRFHERALRAKNRNIGTFVEGLYKRARHGRTGESRIIQVGNCQKELRRITERRREGEEIRVMDVFTYPLPRAAIRRFAGGAEALAVLEEGDDFAKRQIEAFFTAEGVRFSSSGMRPNLENTYWTCKNLGMLFSSLKKIAPDYVVGDLGMFTRETNHVIDSCLSFGSAVSVAMGMSASTKQKLYPFCVTGEGAFAHSGILSMREAAFRGIGVGVIVIDNGGMQSTGGQRVATDIYSLGVPVEQKILSYRTASVGKIRAVLRGMKRTRKLSVLYVEI